MTYFHSMQNAKKKRKKQQRQLLEDTHKKKPNEIMTHTSLPIIVYYHIAFVKSKTNKP